MSVQKQLQRVQVKDVERGEVSAVFATFNVIDSDWDVTLPGAFEDGAEVVISAYGHTSWTGGLPVGAGTIRTTKTEAIMDGRLFLDTTAGRDTFNVLKRLLGRQEWSYGYDVVDAERGTFDGQDVQFLKRLKVHEVSPVLVGAGVNTRTLAVKAAREKGAVVDDYQAGIRPHESRVTVKRWDAAEVIACLAADVKVDDLRAVHAYVDPAADPTDVASYGFLHHHGPGGEANLRACLIGVADLNGVKGSGLSEPERRSVYNHLALHLADGDREVPDLRTPGETGPLKFHEEAAAVLAGLDSLIERTSEVMALRRSKGKAISASTVDILEWVSEGTRRLRALLDSPQEDADREYARYVQSLLLTGDPR